MTDTHISTHDAVSDDRNENIIIYVDGELVHRDDAKFCQRRNAGLTSVVVSLGNTTPYAPGSPSPGTHKYISLSVHISVIQQR